MRQWWHSFLMLGYEAVWYSSLMMGYEAVVV
jgi:hypothetical protein